MEELSPFEGLELPDDSGERRYQMELPDDSGERRPAEWEQGQGGAFRPDGETPDGEERYYDDRDSLYRVGDGLLSQHQYEINGYRYTTDALGRICAVSGTLHLKQREGRLPIRDTIETIGKGDQREGDDRGHLIGDQFDGANGLENMIPQDAAINRNDFKNFEHELANEVRSGKTVEVELEVVYEGESRRPTDLVVSYAIDGEEGLRIFPNDSEREGRA